MSLPSTNAPNPPKKSRTLTEPSGVREKTEAGGADRPTGLSGLSVCRSGTLPDAPYRGFTTGYGPLEMPRYTVEPGATELSGGGSWANSSPCGASDV
jgi:hypothetical protein